MNAVFWILVLGGTVLLWFLCRDIFWGIGEILSDLWSGAKNAMNETEITEFEEDEKSE